MKTDEQYASPSIEEILKAVPTLQWRRCRDCEHVGLYRDNVLPACLCYVCGSADTRNMLRENRILHSRQITPSPDT